MDGRAAWRPLESMVSVVLHGISILWLSVTVRCRIANCQYTVPLADVWWGGAWSHAPPRRLKIHGKYYNPVPIDPVTLRDTACPPSLNVGLDLPMQHPASLKLPWFVETEQDKCRAVYHEAMTIMHVQNEDLQRLTALYMSFGNWDSNKDFKTCTHLCNYN